MAFLFDYYSNEFVHHQKYPLVEFYDPWMADITLVTDLVNHYGKDTTQVLLGNLMYILGHYA